MDIVGTGVELVTPTREGTTLLCRTNYSAMRGLLEYLAEECCTEGSCSQTGVIKLPRVA